MMDRLLLAATLALAASPALAVPPTPGMIAEIDDYRWRELPLVEPYMFDSVYAGDQSSHFEEGMLADVQARYGGTIIENYDHRWLCYDTGEWRIRFVGDYLQFDQPSPLELVTVEKADGPDETCTAKPELANIHANGEVPSIGESVNAILSRFGSAEILTNGRLGYRRVAVLGDEESWTVLTSVYYRLDGDTIDQVAWRVERSDNPHFGGWAEGRYALNSPHAIYTEQTGKFLDGVTVAGHAFSFEKSTLPEAVTALGGELRQQGEAGGHVLWSCLVTGDTRVWLTSDGEMGGPEHELMGITLDRFDDFDFSYGCTDAPAGFALPGLGDIPALGASVADLAKRFGTATEDDRGHIRYFSSTPLGDGTAIAAYQSLDYRIENGVVTGVSLGQETGD